MIVVKKALVVLVSTGLGVLAGTLAATPPIALWNSQATDGPYFPAPLVALGFVALPIGLLLFFLQVVITVYEVLARRAMGNTLLLIGICGGLVAGLLLALALAGSQSDWQLPVVLGGAGVIQGLGVFGGHWLANKLQPARATGDRATW